MYGKSTTPYDQWNVYVQHVRCTRKSLHAQFAMWDDIRLKWEWESDPSSVAGCVIAMATPPVWESKVPCRAGDVICGGELNTAHRQE